MTTEEKMAKMNEVMREVEGRIFDYVDLIYSYYKDKDCISKHEFYQIIDMLQHIVSYVDFKHEMLRFKHEMLRRELEL